MGSHEDLSLKRCSEELSLLAAPSDSFSGASVEQLGCLSICQSQPKKLQKNYIETAMLSSLGGTT